MSTDDAWARDITPTFVKNKEGVLRGIDWGFNAWGGLVDGLYFPWDRDNKAARKICDLMEIDCYDQRSFILEGGSIHSDGEGTLMVTESCLLSGGRNPKMSKEEITEHLCKTLGVKKVLWLPYGIYQDETNEHVDNICAFTSPGEVVLGWTDDESDPQYPMSRANLEYLSHETDAKGRPIKVHKLPLPSPIYVTEEDCAALDPMDGEPTRVPGDRLAASYVNFYIANGAIVMPAFGDKNDQKDAEILQALFPTREIVPIYARDILVGGENFGCGSSREHAPVAIKAAGIDCVIAKSFARIFYRNAINIGLPILECPAACDAIAEGNTVRIDFDTGLITDETTGQQFQAVPFPPFIQQIIAKGGLMNSLKD